MLNLEIKSHMGKNDQMRKALDKLKNTSKLFLAMVVAPTLIAILYFGLIASDVYVSESSFVVRRADKPAGAGFGVLLKTAGFSNGSDEMQTAKAYVLSRDALKQLNEKSAFQNAYDRGHISFVDRFNPTGLYGSFEDLYRFYQNKVTIDYDTSSSIGTLTVRAYTRADAHRINTQLLQLTEKTVNRLSVRARNDLIRVAEQEVADAKKEAQDKSLALSRYRNRSGIIDPERQAAIQMQMISKLQDQLIISQTQLAQLQALAPQNPQIASLRTTIASLREEMTKRTKQIAGDDQSLSDVAVEYQRLFIENQFAEKQLVALLASLAEARSEARKQQAYIERIAQPSDPDIAVEPKRLRGILTTLVLGLIAFGIASMLMAGIREHQD